MVEHQPSKLTVGVRFPSPAPNEINRLDTNVSSLFFYAERGIFPYLPKSESLI